MRYAGQLAPTMFGRRYSPLAVYQQSKLLNALFAFGFRDRFSGLGVSAACVDPGLVRTEIGLKDTGGLVKFVWGSDEARRRARYPRGRSPG